MFRITSKYIRVFNWKASHAWGKVYSYMYFFKKFLNSFIYSQIKNLK